MDEKEKKDTDEMDTNTKKPDTNTNMDKNEKLEEKLTGKTKKDAIESSSGCPSDDDCNSTQMPKKRKIETSVVEPAIAEECKFTTEDESPSKQLKLDEYNGPGLETLADEILLTILSYCDSYSLVRLGRTCTRLKTITQDHTLWHTFDFTSRRFTGEQIKHQLRYLSDKTTAIKVRGFVSKFPLDRWKNETITRDTLKFICKHAYNVEIIHLYESCFDIRPIHVGEFPRNIKELILDSCCVLNFSPVSTFFHKIEEYCPHLTKISMQNCDWFIPYYLLAFSKLQHLKDLNLNGCLQLKAITPYGGIASRMGFKALEKLDIRNCPISDYDVQCLSCISSLKEVLMEFKDFSNLQVRSNAVNVSNEPFKAFKPREGSSSGGPKPIEFVMLDSFGHRYARNPNPVVGAPISAEAEYVILNGEDLDEEFDDADFDDEEDLVVQNIMDTSGPNANEIIQINCGNNGVIPNGVLHYFVSHDQFNLANAGHPAAFIADLDAASNVMTIRPENCHGNRMNVPAGRPSQRYVLAHTSTVQEAIKISSLVTNRGICSFGRSNVLQDVVHLRQADMEERPLSKLERIVIRNYKYVDDAVLKHFKLATPDLKYLDVSGTSVSAKAIAEFKLYSPDCIVISSVIQ